MKLLLIRHGETVDNVANNYAGITDSALTAHGTAQAACLSVHLAAALPPATHVFSSDLQRARRTAEAVLAAQPGRPPRLVQLPILREQDFGSLEGHAFSRTRAPPGPRHRRQPQPGDPGFRAVETRASLAVRAAAFVDGYLVPVLLGEAAAYQREAAASQRAPPPLPPRPGTATRERVRPVPSSRRASAPAALAQPAREAVVLVVSHGVLLSNVWRALLDRLDWRGVAVGATVHLPRPDIMRLGPWSNTGYLSLQVVARAAERHAVVQRRSQVRLEGWDLEVVAVNSRDHLRGLKRTGGGVGSTAVDERQPRIEAFFAKKPRTT